MASVIGLAYRCVSRLSNDILTLTVCSYRSSNREDAAFDEIIGQVQDILLGRWFHSSSPHLLFYSIVKHYSV